jgi:hypothetical protein
MSGGVPYVRQNSSLLLPVRGVGAPDSVQDVVPLAKLPFAIQLSLQFQPPPVGASASTKTKARPLLDFLVKRTRIED